MKKVLSILLAVLMIATMMFGFGSVRTTAYADNGVKLTSPPSSSLSKVLNAKYDYLKEKVSVPKKSGRISKLPKTPTTTIDGVAIPKDIAHTALVKSGWIRVMVDCGGEPILKYALSKGIGVDHITESVVGPEISELKTAHSQLKSKALTNGVTLRKVRDMYIAYNGFAAEVKISELPVLYRIYGKQNVHIARLYKVSDSYANALIGSGPDGAWNDPGVDGTGMYVGVVDTGIDYMHPDLGGHQGITFPTEKVPAGYDFGDDDPDPMDCQGHGTHVSGIIAADGAVKGVAPKAKIVIAKIVSGCEGSAWSDDIAAAFDYMADPNNVDGGPEGTHPPVASVNMSFGADYGFVDPNAPDQKAIEACIAAGIPVALAAGNAGTAMYNPTGGGNYSFFPDSASIGSPAVTPNCMAVAASWNAASRYPALTELSSGDKYAYTIGAESPDPVAALGDNNGAGYEYVYCGLGGDASDFPASVEGKIALIQRGNYSFETKINNAAAAGAIGVIIFNHDSGGDSLITMEMGSATLPAVFIGHSAGEALLAKAQNAEGDGTGRVAFYANTYVDVPDPVDQITSFSSWGPPPDLSFKPDITAPGGGIFSTIPVAQGSYASWSGTSMATPIVTACMALVKEAHPTWTPDQIKTALMNTSKILEDPSSGLPYSPHLMGAGRVDIYNALHTNATVVNKADSKPYVALGEIPDYKTNPITFTVTVTNNGSSDVTYDINANTQTVSVSTNWGEANTESITSPATITTNPSSTVTVNMGSSVDVQVTIDAKSVPDESGAPYIEGFVTFTPQDASADAGGVPAGQIHIPYMGFLGKWNDFNEDDWQFNPVMDPPADDPKSLIGATWPEFTDGSNWYYCGVDFNGNLDRDAIAFNPNDYSLEANLWLLRNAENMKIEIKDASGSTTLRTIDDINQLYKMGWYYYNPNNGNPWWWDGTVYSPSNSNYVSVPDGSYYLVLSATPPKLFNKPHFDPPQVIDFPVKVDTQDPTVSITNVEDLHNGTFEIDWNATDSAPSSGIWGYAVMIDGDFDNIYWVAPNESSFTTPLLTAGQHEIDVFVFDNANNIGAQGVLVTPSSSVTINSPTDGAFVNSSYVDVNYTVSADVYTKVKVDSNAEVFNDVYTTYKCGPLMDGSHTVEVIPVTKDVYMNPAGPSASVSFTVDTVAPVVEVLTPDDREVFTSSTVEVKGSVSDVNFDKLVITPDEGDPVTITDTGDFDETFEFTTEGEHKITFDATDKAGNETNFARRFYITTQSPVINLTSPTTYTYPTVPADVYFEGTVTTPIGDIISFTINGDPVALNSDGSFSKLMTFNSAGQYKITLFAENTAGLTTTEYVTLNVGSVSIKLNLKSGSFNLVSFPFTVTSSDIPNFVKAYTFDWSNYWSTLTTFEPGKGYWIKVSQDESVTLTGVPTASPFSVEITSGKFNLLGVPFNSSIDISALNSANGNHILKIYSFDWSNYWQVWTPNGDQDFTTLEPGKGYWILFDGSAPTTFTFTVNTAFTVNP